MKVYLLIFLTLGLLGMTANATDMVVEGNLIAEGDVKGENVITTAVQVSADLSVATSLLKANASSGKVGVGTASPSEKLHVAGDARVDGTIKIQNGSTGTITVNGYNFARAYPTRGNFFFGDCGNLSATGLDNTAIGGGVLGNLTTGQQNFGMGVSALYSLTSGWSNVAIGSNALYSVTTANYNIGIGKGSLINAKTGSNVGIGGDALYDLDRYTTSTSGGCNVGIGYLAGYDSILDSGCTFLGAWAKRALGSSTLNNATAIGYGAQVSASDSIVLGSSGVKVGIGVTNPQKPLHVVGDVKATGGIFIGDTQRIFSNGSAKLAYLELDTNDTSPTCTGPAIFAAKRTGTQINEVYAKDSSGVATQLSSHANPQTIDPQAQSSFSDLSVTLPFSFHHKSSVIGKGEIVDMSKMVAYVEKKMKSELGDKAGQLVYSYNLPPQETITTAQWEKAAVEKLAQKIQAQIKEMPWIKVNLESDGAVPDEALEEVAETKMREKKIEVNEKVMDFAKRKVVEITRQQTVLEPVPTGRKITRFKEGWELRNGDLFRKATLDDINIGEMMNTIPNLPGWILDRANHGQQIGMAADTLMNEIRRYLSAQSSGTATKDTAQLSTLVNSPKPAGE